VFGLLLVAAGCGSSTTPGAPYARDATITAFAPATAIPSGQTTDFSVYVDSAFAGGDLLGATVQVRFAAASGTPFQGGTTATLVTTGVLVSGHEVVGVCPVSGILESSQVDATVRLDFPSGLGTTSATPLAHFAPPPLAVLGFGPSSVVVGSAVQDFTVAGTGFGPVGGQATVTFLAQGGAVFCDGSTSFSVTGTIASSTAITGRRPATAAGTNVGCLVRVTETAGSATSAGVLVTFTPHHGSGTFQDTGQALATDHASNVAVGDLDGDGDLDLVTASSSVPEIRVFLNDGTGTFSAGPVLGAQMVSAGARVALGDVDGDGDLDIVRAPYNLATTCVYRNDGTGSFADTGIALPTGPWLAITAGDLDGDGAADLVLSQTGAGARVLLNDGTGVFTDSGQSLGSGGQTAGLGNIDADGDLDVAVGSGSAMSLYRNDGTGLFSYTGQSLGTGLLFGVAFGDLDGDGDTDVAGAFEGGGGRAFLNDGSGAFTYTGQALISMPGTPEEKSTFGIALADVDADCDLDVALGHAWGAFPPSNDGDEIWLNDGGAGFTDSGQGLGTSDLNLSLVLADLDGDGDPDLISAHGGGSTVQVFRNVNAP
jgi:hypothetical protein